MNIQKYKFLSKEQINYVLSEIAKMRNIISKEVLYIEICGSFGKNSIFQDHFNCLAVENMVAITPDEKVYNCIFDTSKGNEIGYIDYSNRVMIDESIKANSKTCKILKNIIILIIKE